MKAPAIYAVLLVLSAALFLLAPGVDLAVSRLFFDPQQGFPLGSWLPLVLLENSIRWISWGIGVVVLGGAAWLWWTGRPLWRLDRKALVFVAAATLIGPGLIVNAGFKDHWGRARPSQIVAFDGVKQFTPAPLPANQCARNCAFVSGHAALGFSLVSFALLLPAGRKRRTGVGAAIAFGGVVGLARIAAGGHFLSDIVDAGLIVIAVCWLLHRWIVEHDGLAALATVAGRLWLAATAFVAVEAAAILWIDRPLADYFHADAVAIKPFFEVVQRFGIGYPYLVATAFAFALMRWGGDLPPLRPWAAVMRADARIPAFMFAAIAASGLTVDLLKVVVGRTRPKLLFASGSYDFGWFGLRPDDWSFPSGHAATAAAAMAALWCLWPRPLLLYLTGAALVAASRVVTGAHYLSDVIAGAAIAVAMTRTIASWMLPQRPPMPVEREAARRYPAV